MGIFLDIGFFLGIYHPKDSHHTESCSILKRLGTGQYGLIYSSPYIVSEVATLLLIRTSFNQNILDEFYSDLYGVTKFVSILPWSSEIEQKVWELFRKINGNIQSKKELLSFVDVSNIIYCREYQIDKIAAYDSHFDRFLVRISD
jgi:predicted nucleic acid-binding protein